MKNGVSLQRNMAEIYAPLTQVNAAVARGINLKPIFAVRSSSMMDVAVLAIGFVFFTASIAYVYACDRL